MGEEINKLEKRIKKVEDALELIEEIHNMAKGAYLAAKIFWIVLGSGVLGFLGMLGKKYLNL